MDDVPPYSATVIYDYIPDDPAEQSCHDGEVITITNNENPDWLYFENSSGQKGWIPQKYVEKSTVPSQSSSAELPSAAELPQSAELELPQCAELLQSAELPHSPQSAAELPQPRSIPPQSANTRASVALPKEETIRKMQELGKNKIVKRVNDQKAQSINRIGNFLYVPLKEIVERESTLVPTFFWNATNYIENRACKQEGIYRLSSDKSEVEKLREKLEKDPDMPIPMNADNNVVATLVKRFLQFLPASLIPSEFYSSILDCHEEQRENVKLSNLVMLIGQFPREHLNLFLVFLKHIQAMLKHSASTNMGVKNFATIFSPCIFRKEESRDGQIALGDLAITCNLTELMCTHADEIVGKFPFPQMSIFADLVGPSDYAVSVNPFTGSPESLEAVSGSSAYSDVIQFPLPPATKPKMRMKKK